MSSIYPHSTWPQFSVEERTAVEQVLASGKVNYWTGLQCQLFEQEFAAYHHAEYGIALANGTVALELALNALGIEPGDEVIVPCRTFIATASAVVACHAKPVVVDVDSVSQNITAATIAPHITNKTKAIIVVHLAGWPCDMDPIMALAKQHRLLVIEDCAQAHGARYKGRPVGSIGDAAAFSFCQDKIMTTGGEGGMLLTQNTAVWEKAWSYKDHGKSYQQAHTPRIGNRFRFIHDSFGSNFRMTEMQAAIGREQLKRLPQWLQHRQRNAAVLNRELRSIEGLRLTEPTAEYEHAYYKYYVFLQPTLLAAGIDNQTILQQLEKQGMPCFSGICPEIQREQAFIQRQWGLTACVPNAAQLGQTSLMLTVDPTLTPNDMQHYAAGLQEAMLNITAIC